MLKSEELKQLTRQEWRELGFFYDRDEATKEWCIRGSRQGLMIFSRILNDYAGDPRNAQIAEHDHLGPYMYLTIGTWSAAEITDYWIAGSPGDLIRLSNLISERVSEANEGEAFTLREHFAPESPYELRIEVRADDFDPASSDLGCW